MKLMKVKKTYVNLELIKKKLLYEKIKIDVYKRQVTMSSNRLLRTRDTWFII